jgi:hypothetical protein
MICEIIVHLLVTVQNNESCTVQGIKITETQQANIYSYKNPGYKVTENECSHLV